MKNNQGPIRALLTDDEPISLMLLEALMQSFSIEPISAIDVASAKKALLETVPHFAILDVLLPDGDGTEILVEIKKKGLPTAVAFITSSLMEFPFHKCESYQPDMLFTKPVDQTAVLAWIEKETPQVLQRMTRNRTAA